MVDKLREAIAAVKKKSPILVIDDAETCFRLLEFKLNVPCVWARTGEEALSILVADASRFSAVIVDQILPGMLGTQVMREIRRQWPGLPIILLSGFKFSDEERLDIAQAGALLMLSKPIDNGDIDAILSLV